VRAVFHRQEGDPLSIDLHFDGSTECRGRNGWFQLRTAELSHWQHDGSSCAYFYSSKSGNMPPIVLHFHNPEELRTLICGLAKALAQMTTVDACDGKESRV